MSSADLHVVLHTLLPGITNRAGANIEVRLEPALVAGHVLVDVESLRDAVLALVDNAMRAMPDGGTLTVRTEHVEAAGAEFGPVPPLAPGRYMRVTVQDTGHGMEEPERVDAIDAQPGDSRGLARVLDLVRDIRGALWLDSARAQGTRAFLYLPLVQREEGAHIPTVLLVEDEASVRSVVRRMLLGQGFAVREARDGETALRLWHAGRTDIRAVVTDVVMPVMGGRDLARELRVHDDRLPVLFISAYASDEPGLLDGVHEPRQLLAKPFTNDTLLSALRRLVSTHA